MTAKDTAAAVTATIDGLAFEIARRVTADMPPGVGTDLFRGKLAAIAGEVICDWMLGNFEAKAVHILRTGLPLCRFSMATPNEWPKGHKWVGLDEAEQATCPRCLRLAQTQKNARPKPGTVDPHPRRNTGAGRSVKGRYQ